MSIEVLVLKEAKGNLLWSFSLLTILVQALAIVALARRAVELDSLSAPLELVMAAYTGTTQLLFGWAEPHLRAALAWINGYSNWHLTLYPHWKDYFVIFGVLGTANTRLLYPEAPDVGRLRVVARKVLAQGWEVIAAAIAAMVGGVLPLHADGLLLKLATACLPIATFILCGGFAATMRFSITACYVMVALTVLVALDPRVGPQIGLGPTKVIFNIGDVSGPVISGLCALLFGFTFIAIILPIKAWRFFRGRADQKDQVLDPMDDPFELVMLFALTLLGGFLGPPVSLQSTQG
jgi:hypothetical protein